MIDLERLGQGILVREIFLGHRFRDNDAVRLRQRRILIPPDERNGKYLENVLFSIIKMVSVIAYFMPDEDDDEDTHGHADGQTQDIDKGIIYTITWKMLLSSPGTLSGATKSSAETDGLVGPGSGGSHL
ncbi:MAG: hypothetical protein OEW18_04045 [Candidatus Aminicenantes bacterium]|nr:hypothetical protein [Candidatus Aminicenantes bacterium]